VKIKYKTEVTLQQLVNKHFPKEDSTPHMDLSFLRSQGPSPYLFANRCPTERTVLCVVMPRQ